MRTHDVLAGGMVCAPATDTHAFFDELPATTAARTYAERAGLVYVEGSESVARLK